MSVEEARYAVEGHEYCYRDCGKVGSDVDRLILEVKAGMPCYGWDSCELRRRFHHEPATLVYYPLSECCLSCQARAELEKGR